MNLVGVPPHVSAKAHVIAGDAKRLTSSLTHATTLQQALANKQTIVRMMANLRDLQAMNRPLVIAARELEKASEAKNNGGVS